MKKIIAIDIDDVLADSTEALRQEVNKRMGISLGVDEFKVPGPYWQYYEHVLARHNLLHLLPHAELESQMETNQSHIIPIQGSQAALESLSKKYEIVLVTARNPTWAAATEKWMHQHYSGVFADLHVIGSKKFQGESAKTKGEVCQQIGANWLIDDNPEHCLSAIAHGTEAVLFGDYGWHFDAPEHLVKCKDWPAVLDYFNEQKD